MAHPDPTDVINHALGSLIQPHRSYPEPLPAELTAWYCYPADAGHSILVVIADDLSEDDDPENYLCPAPVKMVLRYGWTVHNGYILCNLPYDQGLGLTVGPEDEEYSDEHASGGLHRYEVGQLYHPDRNNWPEGVELRLTERSCQFLLFFQNPSSHEVRAVQRGNAEFALVPRDRFLLWLYRFTNTQTSNPKQQGIPWSDSPWEASRQAQRLTPSLPGVAGSSIALHILLVDAGNGILQAQRMVGLPVPMADALRQAVARQHDMTPDPGTVERELNALYQRYRSVDLLSEATAHCTFTRD